jgi:hypothetical protein
MIIDKIINKEIAKQNQLNPYLLMYRIEFVTGLGINIYLNFVI